MLGQLKKFYGLVIIVFSSSIYANSLSGQVINPCPSTLTLDKAPILNAWPFFQELGEVHFSRSGTFSEYLCGDEMDYCLCEYSFDWVKSELEDGGNLKPDIPLYVYIDLWMDPNTEKCLNTDNWIIDPGLRGTPLGYTETSRKKFYRGEEYRVMSGFLESPFLNKPVVTAIRFQSIVETIFSKLKPFLHTVDCGPNPIDSLPFNDLSAISLTPQCSTETFNTLVKNAWPEIGDDESHFFLIETEGPPEEDIEVRFYLSHDSQLSDDDQILTDVILEKSEFSFNEELNTYTTLGVLDLNVDGGTIIYEDASAHLDLDDIPTGLYYIIEQIDPLNKVMESNEGNNISTRPSPIVISEFKGGSCDCCPQTIMDAEGDIGELITKEPSSMNNATGGRVIYLTNADAYSVSCGYRMKSGGSNGASFEIGHISWQDDEPFIRSTVSEGANDEDFCDFREFTHDVRRDLALLGFYDRFTSTIPKSLMEEHNRLLASAFENRVAPRSKICNADCEEIVESEIVIYDANPLFITRGIFGGGTINNIRDISDELDLEDDVNVIREAVACDGVSEVLLRAAVSDESAFAIWELENEKYGKIETPWASRTVNIDGQHYVYAIYTPPENLSELDSEINENGILSSKIPISFKYENESELIVSAFELELVAPPVILVHGTFDNPDNCWRTPINTSHNTTIVNQLEENGFKVWTVDYSQTNGLRESSFLYNTESTFEANRKVVYDNTGGIKDAIDSYRSDHNIAATRSDVIGHSMGGVLPRVYGATPEYKRSENFNRGDINRLITIASTHHGSDLSYFGHFFNESWKDLDLPLHQRLANTAFIYGQWLMTGMSETGAVRNQFPSSEALRDIGPTEIPCHAIVCTISDFEDIKNDIGDQATNQYEDLFEGLASVFYFYPGGITGFFLNLIRTYNRHPESQRPLLTGSDFQSIPKSELNMMRRGSQIDQIAVEVAKVFSNQWESWQVLMDDEDTNWVVDEERYELDYNLTESNYFDTEDDARIYMSEQKYDLIAGEELQPAFNPAISMERRDSVIDFLRYIIFRNDLNDGVVGYQSQRGGLDEQYISHFNKNLHGYAPRYPQIINRITALLKSGMDEYAPNGFPMAGDRLPMEIPDPVKLNGPSPSNEFKVGCEAACWSGMVPSHAEAFAKIAGEENKVILARPVNPDATTLIEMNAATKGMKLKGKSSNWGPQKGYITQDQRYSKIWQQYSDPVIRKKEIESYNKKVKDLLEEDKDIATSRQLELEYTDCTNKRYFVYIDSTIEDAEQSLFLASDTTQNNSFFKWDINDNDGCPIDEQNPVSTSQQLKALHVIANPDPELLIEGKPRYYTADYDLLAIGFYNQSLAGNHNDECPYPTLPPFNSKTGLITPEQSELLELLNQVVKSDGMYEGGDVSHHGPENQFYVLNDPIKGSPYVDYPITAFFPETKYSRKGRIMSIPRGPAGFRDIYLKRFMAEKRREGYDLYDNVYSPGWKWRELRPYSYARGWADRDAPGLMDSPEQIPFPENCDCDKSNLSLDMYQEELAIMSKPIPQVQEHELSIFPNPATHLINSSIVAKKEETIIYRIIDRAGRIVDDGEVVLDVGRNKISIDISQLLSGLYYLSFSSREKIVSKSFIVER